VHRRRVARRAGRCGRPDRDLPGRLVHRRRIARECFRPRQARGRREDRSLRTLDRRTRAPVDRGWRVCRTRLGALPDTRRAARRGLRDRCDAALARVRPVWCRRGPRNCGGVFGTAAQPSTDRQAACGLRRTRTLAARDRDRARMDGRHGARSPTLFSQRSSSSPLSTLRPRSRSPLARSGSGAAPSRSPSPDAASA
jgi:hypothetical protein